jgi:glyoxylase-like metal-dependent hydrolase (beta-lactamase superfamily II)
VVQIVNVGYDSTNYYVLIPGGAALLVDVGFPGTLPKLQHSLRRSGITLASIGHVLATHYHPDHAGLLQELKQQGVRLLVLEPQLPAVPVLGTYMKPAQRFQPIRLHDNVVSSIADSRALLRRLGFDGEVLATPGHSDDSVSLVLDSGAAFTGDLPPPHMILDDSGSQQHSWAAIRARRAHTIYPGHGSAYRLARALDQPVP